MTPDDDVDAVTAHRARALADAAETMHAVRERCVWTQRITHRDLVPYLIEESHELIDAVESGSRAELREELGDVLWQVLFHAEIASRDAEAPFDIGDVAADLTRKMVRRHPHVFAGEIADTPERVLELWSAAKAAEKRERVSVLDGVARGMPALALAQKMLGKAVAVGAGPSTGSGSAAGPSTGSGPDALTSTESSRVADIRSEADLGDALLHLVAQARESGWDAERALRERLRALESEIRTAERRTRPADAT
jgi:XTP/dITP diphosphohydrolase